jgi:hypothetical protein
MNGAHKTAEQVEVERVYLLAFGADVDDTGQWTVNGQPATPWQLRQIARATPAAWANALTLVDLDVEHAANTLEQLQREQIRRAAGMTGTDEGHDTP